MEASVHLSGDFIAHLASRGISENTRTEYARDLVCFFTTIDKPATDIQRVDIQQYFVIRMGQGIGARTLSRHLSTLRAYYSFLLDMEELTNDPTRGVHPPKQPKKLQKAISQQDLEALVNSLGQSPLDIRDRAILLTLYASGLRANELINLKPADLDLDGMTARVWAGKGDKDGIVPLTPRSVEALRAYLASYPVTGKLFPFTRQALWVRITQLSKKVLGRSVSPHRIRAGTATALLKGGSDIRITQTVMRHSSIDTTQLYLDVSRIPAGVLLQIPSEGEAMNERVQEFVEYLRASNMSKHTIRAYTSDIREFVASLSAEEIKRKNIHQFVTLLSERRLSKSTIRRKMAAVKSFLDWLHIETDIPDVMNGMKRPKAPETLPDIPEQDEVCRMIESVLIPRNRAILELLYGSGVRNNELCGINTDDMEGNDCILIRGKGAKERRVIYGEYAREALTAWLQVREYHVTKYQLQTPALFFSTGPHRSAERLDVRSIHRIVTGAARDAKLTIHPHLLRHSFATHCFDQGMPLEVINKLLGHERLSTTAHYARVSPKKMLEAFQKAHPHA